MTRRDFLKTAIASSFYLTARRIFSAGLVARPDVGITVGTDYEKAVTKAIDLLGGITAFVKPGDTVVVKPNIGWNSPPELKATTDPMVVRTIVHLCFQALASKVYVFDRSVANSRLTYVTSGIQKAAEEAGAKVFQVDDISNAMYKRVSIPGALYLKESLVNKYVLESDVLINVPIAKSHGEAGLTLAMKNLMGVTGDQRGKWHWQLDDAIADINRAVRSKLILIDASSIMLRNGPTGGSMSYLKKLDTFIAASNVVSADVEAARLFGRSAEDLPYIVEGAKAGVGRASGYSVQRSSA
ncbi:MAG: DUF362 domain-containing protein [Spirochaetia bacterium]|jgi:uncharacterized protein (DUF362 family)